MRSVHASAQARSEYKEHPAVQTAIKEAESALGESGRVLVRASGTEPLIRVMLEGTDEEKIKMYCDAICRVIEESF